jgi:DUF4097 and DUF4098 domain-containing protein YvlB
MSVHQTPGDVFLRLRVPAGWIHITTKDTAETSVRIIPLNDDPASRAAAGEIREEARQRGDSYEVTILAPERGHRFFSFGRDPQLGIEIEAPSGASLDVSTGSADITGSGLFGDVTVRSASGDIALDRVGGAASAKSASGDIRLGEVAGGADVKTASGDVTIRKTEGLRAALVSGDLDVAELSGATNAGTVSGDIRIRAAIGGDITLRSVSGDVLFDVRPGCSVWMDVNSLSGTTSSELQWGEAPASGRPDIQLRAHSVSGDIRITRGYDRAAADV